MRITKLARCIDVRSRLPRGYGVGYYNVNTLEAVVYPIPLNLFVHWAHAFWYSIIRYRSTMNERIHELDDALDKERKKNWELQKRNEELQKQITDLALTMSHVIIHAVEVAAAEKKGDSIQ